MKVLFIGYGSIAAKHAKALKTLYPNNLSLGAWRRNENSATVSGVVDFYDAQSAENFNPDFLIISNPTAEHLPTIEKVLYWQKPLFIEKPLSHTLKEIDALSKSIKDQGIITYTACNLRFLGSINFIKDKLLNGGEKVEEVNAYCGSYLPDWRPQQNYRNSYSANLEMGGGVHLDLIHEVDYLVHLFGLPEDTFKRLSSHSNLEIDAVDYAHYSLSYARFTANVTLNYFRKKPKRTLEIITVDNIYMIDLLKNQIYNEMESQIIYKGSDGIIDTYESQLRYFIKHIEENDSKIMNSFEEASNILKVVLDE